MQDRSTCYAVAVIADDGTEAFASSGLVGPMLFRNRVAAVEWIERMAAQFPPRKRMKVVRVVQVVSRDFLA